MSNFAHEPRNWRNVANVTDFGIICRGEGMHCGHIEKCNTCKMSEFNPKKNLYIQSCKDRLNAETKEKEMEEKKRYDLTRIGAVLSLTPVEVEVANSNRIGGCYHVRTLVAIGNLNGRFIYTCIKNTGHGSTDWDYARHILRKVATAMRPMTAQEVAMLPRGTAFVGNDASATYAPTITAPAEDGSAIDIGGYMISEYCGYRLPNETLIRPFTTEEEG